MRRLLLLALLIGLPMLAVYGIAGCSWWRALLAAVAAVALFCGVLAVTMLRQIWTAAMAALRARAEVQGRGFGGTVSPTLRRRPAQRPSALN